MQVATLAGAVRRLFKLRIELMWIVALALRRPYTFTVFAILILIAGLVGNHPNCEGYFSFH